MEDRRSNHIMWIYWSMGMLGVLMFLLIMPWNIFETFRQTPESSDESSLSHRKRWIPISIELDPNYTSTLLSQLPMKVGDYEPTAAYQSYCERTLTTNISILRFDDKNPVKLVAGEVHEFVIFTLDENGRRRCSGGDYFELDLSSKNWKSRPPIKDHGNGLYSFYLQIHEDFAGPFVFTIQLLFRSFQGFRFQFGGLAYKERLRRVPIIFYRPVSSSIPSSSLPNVPLCRSNDFRRYAWTGRWTRHVWDSKCDVSVIDGRYRCIDSNASCENPWCQGQVGLLESNGWVYSAHCSFHIYTQDQAWKCLHRKMLFFWGDSNHVDTIRNLMSFILGHSEWNHQYLDRKVHKKKVYNPKNSSEFVTITNVFNGHWNISDNFLGQRSLLDDKYRNHVRSYFIGNDTPDVFIMNSGLHDGGFHRNVSSFVGAVEYTVGFWKSVFRGLREEGRELPMSLYRTTVATAGNTSMGSMNPQKMEGFNSITVEKMIGEGFFDEFGFGLVDDFDMTFPWHYDYRLTDGLHYGRPPRNETWFDGKIGHKYFADLMLIHVLLNSICHDQPQQW
ncbi:hypothetical protein ZOSMA_85G00180 [Zostera marina]|uniref:Uncharacterized protein n=1 Tax=Zostera marina TaxID=29655 RepID=A0A0K9NL06_ZOSMR|nr:hypothetical protein ZOSMA_85G00180 [Zostera marina]